MGIKEHIKMLENDLKGIQRIIEMEKKVEVNNSKLIKLNLFKERLEKRLKDMKDSGIDR